MTSFIHAAEILMSCIPSFLNVERDSFPIENAGKWRGSRHTAAVAEGLHGLTAALARELGKQWKRNIVPLTKEAVIMPEVSQVRIRHPHTAHTMLHSFLWKE